MTTGATQTARERARAQITAEIKAEARRQLVEAGAQRLSLRAVARELGMVSSALYRYFPSRDDLLTALIIDAYDAVGAAAERAVARLRQAGPRRRWQACCDAVRQWALENPHEYALIYGSPVPGYQAPQETIGPATRVALVIGSVVADGWPAGRPAGEAELPGVLAGQAQVIAEVIAPHVPGPVIARTLLAWTALFGMLSFELFGQLHGVAEPADEFFAYSAGRLADLIGLPGA